MIHCASREPRSHRRAYAILLGLLILRATLGYCYYAASEGFAIRIGNGVERILMAWNWARTPSFFCSGLTNLPLYIWITGIVLRVFPGGILTAPALVNSVFSLGVLVLIFKLAAMLSNDDDVGLLAATVTLLQPALIETGTLGGDADPLLQFFILTGCLFWVCFERLPRARYGAAAAVAFSLASMVRYEGWFLLPAFTILSLRSFIRAWNEKKRPRFALGVEFLATSLLAWWFIIAWLIYNQVAYHHPLQFMSSNALDPILFNIRENLIAYFQQQASPVLLLAALWIGDKYWKDEVHDRYLLYPLGFFVGFILATILSGTNPYLNRTWPFILLLMPLAAEVIRSGFGRNLLRSLFLVCVCGLLVRDSIFLWSRNSYPPYHEDVHAGQRLLQLYKTGILKNPDLTLVEIREGVEKPGGDRRVWSTLALRIFDPGRIVLDRQPNYIGGAHHWHLDKERNDNTSILDLESPQLARYLRQTHIEAAIVYRRASVQKLSHLMKPVAAFGDVHLFAGYRQ